MTRDISAIMKFVNFLISIILLKMQ